MEETFVPICKEENIHLQFIPTLKNNPEKLQVSNKEFETLINTSINNNLTDVISKTKNTLNQIQRNIENSNKNLEDTVGSRMGKITAYLKNIDIKADSISHIKDRLDTVIDNQIIIQNIVKTLAENMVSVSEQVISIGKKLSEYEVELSDIDDE